MSSNALMPVRYIDQAKKISLQSYADTIVYDDSGGQKVLCAIRFGGYPEQVEAMARAISGGGTIEVVTGTQPLALNTLAKRYRQKISHDGVYAECTLIAEDENQQIDSPPPGGKKGPSDKKAARDDLEDSPAPAEQQPPRSVYLYVPPGDREALFAAVDQKTAVPLIPQFADYLLDALVRRGILVPMKIHAVSPSFESWVLKCAQDDRNIIEVVEDGLATGAITIPGIDAHSHNAFDGIDSVTQYLTRYGPAIAQRIKGLFDPLFDPGRDTLSPQVLNINRTIMEKAGYSLYDAQLAVAESIKRQLERHKVGLVIAECGAGKSKIGLSAIAPVVAGLGIDQARRQVKKSFNLVLCPAHISKKWVREIEESLPGTFAGVVSGITELNRLYDAYAKGDKNCYAIISKETARDGFTYGPAVRWNKRLKAFLCPGCGEAVQMPISNDGTTYLVNADQFFFKLHNKKSHKCGHCGAPLWTAINPKTQTPSWVKISDYGFVYRDKAHEHYEKIKNAAVLDKLYGIQAGSHRTAGAHRRYPLSTYIKKKYKGRIDGLIVDELHNYNNDSGQGDAMGELLGVAKKVIGMTATLINGYAGGLFYLLYRLVPGLMLRDGKPYSNPSEFIKEYGVVEHVYELTEADYNANRRASKRKKRTKQLPGVSPLVYSRFLLEHAAFLSLTDMGKELPEYEEIPVPLKLPVEIKSAYAKMQQRLVTFMKQDRKAAKRVLSAYLNLLTAYPDQPYGQPPIVHPYDGYEIVSPPHLGSMGTLMPKDEAVLEIVQRKLAKGERVLIYTNWTRLDTQKKLHKLLTGKGCRAEILPATVMPRMREEWVEKCLNGGMQTLICNPSLMETGLDLNAFTTLIFYDTGYKLFTLRQASRRSWRINQTAPRVEVYMLYYEDTMQHKAMKLMASKLAVAAIIEGGFSEEGLAAMSQCDDMTTLMAKELMLGIKDNVEDVSFAYKRMSFSKSRNDDGTDIFAKAPVALSPLAAQRAPVIEFTFIPQLPKLLPRKAARQPIPYTALPVGEAIQLSLFNEIA